MPRMPKAPKKPKEPRQSNKLPLDAEVQVSQLEEVQSFIDALANTAPDDIPAGRPMYRQHGEHHYSNQTTAMQINGEWVNVPAVNELGEEIPEPMLREMLLSNGLANPLTGEPLEVFSSREEAEAASGVF